MPEELQPHQSLADQMNKARAQARTGSIWAWLSFATAAVISLVAAQPAIGKEECWTMGPSQFADATHFCVSSKLAPQGRWSYGPKNLAGFYGSKGAWCEGAPGPGIGEVITIRIDRGPAFRRLSIRNGYGNSRKAFRNNGRLKKVRITSDTGINTVAELVDQPGAQPLYLPIIAQHRWVRIKIQDVYPGARFSDTCVSGVAPDFEYEEELLQRRENRQPRSEPHTGVVVEPLASQPTQRDPPASPTAPQTSQPETEGGDFPKLPDLN